MAKQIEYKVPVRSREDALRQKLEDAPLEHAEALLKMYSLLETAEKHGILDLLRGAISAEDKIIDKVATYASSEEGINVVRNLLILGKLLGSIDPDWLTQGVKDLTDTMLQESKRRPKGFLTATQRLRRNDAQRGLQITIAALESIGRIARVRAKKLGVEQEQ